MAAVDNLFEFPLLFIIDDNWWWWWLDMSWNGFVVWFGWEGGPTYKPWNKPSPVWCMALSICNPIFLRVR
jgi:hypothetical protein